MNAHSKELHFSSAQLIEMDIVFITRMSSILSDSLEEAFNFSRAREVNGETVTLSFQTEGIDDLHFLIEEIRHRSKLLTERYTTYSDAVGS